MIDTEAVSSTRIWPGLYLNTVEHIRPSFTETNGGMHSDRFSPIRRTDPLDARFEVDISRPPDFGPKL